MPHNPHPTTKGQVKLSQVKNLPAIIFGPTFDKHMKEGDKSGQQHSGLHLLVEFRKADDKALAKTDIVAAAQFQGKIGGHAATVVIGKVDARTRTFTAAVNIYGQAKTSTFFPVETTLAEAKEYIQAAWKDHQTYGSAQYGGNDVDIYKQMRARFHLNWLGHALIGGQKVWVGSALSGSLVTAFPAVDNQFG